MDLPKRGMAVRACAAGMLCALGVAGTASASHPPTQRPIAKAAGAPAWSESGLSAPSIGKSTTASFSAPARAALPPASENLQLVSKLGLETPAQYRIDGTQGQALLPGQIADVTVHKNTAYVNSWSESTCNRGGFFSVDISDPANPKQLAFVPARSGQYHGEGAHAIAVNIPGGFQGDLLAVNNEACSGTRGGFDLYDVSNPAAPQTLAQSVGDRTADRPDGSPFGPLTGTQTPNRSHSVFIWQDGDKAYLVATDNTESADVDIFDITEPTAPVFIADVDLIELGIDQGIDVIGNSGNAEWIYNHDMVVKKINGVQTMLVSYWDAGYIKLDVSDPASPKIIGDSDFGTQDPVMQRASTNAPWSLPEGNAHQAEFSHDNRFVLAADEDFDTHRTLGSIDQGAAGTFTFNSAGHTVNEDGDPYGPQLKDRPIVGKTRYVGAACDGDPIAASSADVKIAIINSDDCAFQEKTENAEAVGYTAVIIFDNSTSAPCDELFGMIFENYTGNAVTLWVTREVGLRMLGVANAQTCSTATPAAPRDGNPISITTEFDGWGYTHLLRNDSTLTPVDAYAIPQAMDPNFATGFGDLTVHEFATDATENLAYSSYYAGGMRVFSFGDNGLEPVGTFIEQSNDFWGVEDFTTADGERLIAGSDRNVGLYLLRYTGPGAPARPVCSSASATAPVGAAVSIPLSCSDANGNPLTLRVAGRPARGTAAISGTTATYSPAAATAGVDTFTIVANDGAADSAPATVTVATAAVTTLPSLKAGPCANDLFGTASRETLSGTSAGDRIRGRAGNDVIRGNAGDDCILGEAGNDRLAGDAGNDDVDGGVGNDRVDGGAGTDEVAGGTGKDTVGGGSGNDRVTGGSDVDKLSGGAGRDRMDGGSGNDSVSGSSGNDRVDGGNGNDKLSGGTGTDTLRGGAGRDTISARGGGRDTIDCGSGRDTVTADRTDRVARNCEVVRRR